MRSIANWKEKYRVGKLDVDDATGATPDQRNPGERLTLLLAGKTVDEEQKGERKPIDFSVSSSGRRELSPKRNEADRREILDHLDVAS